MSDQPIAGKVIAGTLAASLFIAAGVVARWEGTRTIGYADVIGVATACTGHTGDGVVVGKRYTQAQCDRWLRGDLLEAANAVDRCVWVPLKDNEWAAMTSLAFNIGSRAFCRSSVASKANKGDMRGACKAFDLYVYAGGRKIQGLVNRRRDERKLCEGMA